MVIDDIGDDEDAKPIEVLFGALAMQQWGIRLVPEEDRLDLTHYPKQFVEFLSEAGVTAIVPRHIVSFMRGRQRGIMP